MSLKLLIILSFVGISFTSRCQSPTAHHNLIDDINTVQQANTFTRGIFKNDYKNYYIPIKPIYLDSLFEKLAGEINPESFVKADFDNNGYSDLLVFEKNNGKNNNPDNGGLLCIMDSGQNRFYIRKATHFRNSPAIYAVKQIDRLPAILFYHYSHHSANYYKSKKRPQTPTAKVLDTLVYKFGDFVKYNSNPSSYAIQRIKFVTSGCFGVCPVYTIIIDESRHATYVAGLFNKDSSGCKDVKGTFTSVVDEKQFGAVIDVLKAINFEKLGNGYSVNYTDAPTCTLTITYNNGHTKTIQDYGMQGTFGLMRVYKLLSDLRLNQNWH